MRNLLVHRRALINEAMPIEKNAVFGRVDDECIRRALFKFIQDAADSACQQTRVRAGVPRFVLAKAGSVFRSRSPAHMRCSSGLSVSGSSRLGLRGNAYSLYILGVFKGGAQPGGAWLVVSNHHQKVFTLVPGNTTDEPDRSC